MRFNDDPCFPGGKGRTLVADDVIYSLKRFADANLNQFSYSLLQGAFEGMDAFREPEASGGRTTDYAEAPISGISKLDDRHFTIKLTRTNPLALFFARGDPRWRSFRMKPSSTTRTSSSTTRSAAVRSSSSRCRGAA